MEVELVMRSVSLKLFLGGSWVQLDLEEGQVNLVLSAYFAALEAEKELRRVLARECPGGVKCLLCNQHHLFPPRG